MTDPWRKIKISDYARLSINPLRKLKFERIVESQTSLKITLQLGDPTIFGSFPPAQECVEALKTAVETDQFPYNSGNGKLEARKAVAQYSKHQNKKISPDDVILTSGWFLFIWSILHRATLFLF